MKRGFKPTVRIQSDGTGPTTVITLEDGTPVDGIRAATIWLEHDNVNNVSLDILLAQCDVHAVVTNITFTCACCGETVDHECGGTQPHMTMSGKIT